MSVACDGKTAVDKAEKNNFDVILIDLKLPVLNSLEKPIDLNALVSLLAQIKEEKNKGTLQKSG